MTRSDNTIPKYSDMKKRIPQRTSGNKTSFSIYEIYIVRCALRKFSQVVGDHEIDCSKTNYLVSLSHTVWYQSNQIT